jgi:hypothetical protein
MERRLGNRDLSGNQNSIHVTQRHKGIKQHSRNQELTQKIKAGNKEARKQGRQFNHQKTRN